MNISVLSKTKCSGCYTCYNICPTNCISMKTDNEGFWYPKIDEKSCTNCGKCYKTCPVVNPSQIDNQPIAYACINKKEEIRKQSSSGGMFSVFAEYVLDRNGIVFGATYDDNFNIVHNFTDNINSLKNFRGSKYVQSKIGNMYQLVQQFLTENKLVLFVGTPCQVEGLISFLDEKPQNLICLDFFCHGVPSPLLWKKYLDFIRNKNKSKISEIVFRDKKDGWRNFSMKIKFTNNKQYKKSRYKDIFLRAFLSDICLRPSCYNCSFKKLHRISDFTLADFWGVNSILPEMNDNKGLSLILINSTFAQGIFDSLSSKIVFKRTNLNSAIKSNQAILKSASLPKERKTFFIDLINIRFKLVAKKYLEEKLSDRSSQLIQNIIHVYPKKIISKISRIIFHIPNS